jgi:hypothetical protein
MRTDRLVDPVAGVCLDYHAPAASHRPRNGASIDLAVTETDWVLADLPSTIVPGQGCGNIDNCESQGVP